MTSFSISNQLGVIVSGEDEYLIQPLPQGRDYNRTGEGTPHVVYKRSSLQRQHLDAECGVIGKNVLFQISIQWQTNICVLFKKDSCYELKKCHILVQWKVFQYETHHVDVQIKGTNVLWIQNYRQKFSFESSFGQLVTVSR